MQEVVADLSKVVLDIEIAMDQQLGVQPLPFTGMDKSGASICHFFKQNICSRGVNCPFRHVLGDKAVVCKHWLRGLCKKGDQCEFLHEYDMSKMPECYFYSKFGRCDNKDCQYQHIDPESKVKDCPWYDRGFCKHGPNCSKRHRRGVICINYLIGFCPNGRKCKFAHPSWDLPVVEPKGSKCHMCGEVGHKAISCAQNPYRLLDSNQNEINPSMTGIPAPPHGLVLPIPNASNANTFASMLRPGLNMALAGRIRPMRDISQVTCFKSIGGRRTNKQSSADEKKKRNIKRRSLRQKSRRDDVTSRRRDLSPVKERKQRRTDREDGVRLKERLREWKHERDRKKESEKLKRKPTFKVSTHIEREDHRCLATSQSERRRDAGPSEHTRSRSRHENESSQSRHRLTTRRVIMKSESKHDRDSRLKTKEGDARIEAETKSTSHDNRKRKSFAPANFTFKPPDGLPTLDFNASLSDSMTSYILNQDLTTINLPKPDNAIVDPDEEKSIQLPKKLESTGKDLETFRKLHKTATKRLENQSKKWRLILDTGVSKDAERKIQPVIDQAEGLLEKQLKKYDVILDKCMSPHYKKNKSVFEDLEEFWNLIDAKVEAVLDEFKTLKGLKIETRNEHRSPARKDNKKNEKSKRSPGSKKACRRSNRLMIKEIKAAMLDDENIKDQVKEIFESTKGRAGIPLSTVQENALSAQRLGCSAGRRRRSTRRTPKSQTVSKSSATMRMRLSFGDEDEENDDKENVDGAIASKYLVPSEQVVLDRNECADSNGLDAKYLMAEGTPAYCTRRSTLFKGSAADSATGGFLNSAGRTKPKSKVACLQSTDDLITFSPA